MRIYSCCSCKDKKADSNRKKDFLDDLFDKYKDGSYFQGPLKCVSTFEDLIEELTAMPKFQEVTKEQIEETRKDLENGKIDTEKLLLKLYQRFSVTDVSDVTDQSDQSGIDPIPDELIDEESAFGYISLSQSDLDLINAGKEDAVGVQDDSGIEVDKEAVQDGNDDEVTDDSCDEATDGNGGEVNDFGASGPPPPGGNAMENGSHDLLEDMYMDLMLRCYDLEWEGESSYPVSPEIQYALIMYALSVLDEEEENEE